jgi:hypothetical protein
MATSTAAPPPPGVAEPMALDDEDLEPALVWYQLPIMIPGKRKEPGEDDGDGPNEEGAANNAAEGGGATAAATAADLSAPPPPPVMMVVDWPAVVEKIERRTFRPPQQHDVPSVCPTELRMLRFEGLKFLVGTRNSPDHKTLSVARLLGWDSASPVQLLLDPRAADTLTKEESDFALVGLTDGSYVPMSLPKDEADPDTWRAYQRGLEEALDLMGDGLTKPAPRKMQPPTPSQPVSVPTATTAATAQAATTTTASSGQRGVSTKRVSIEVPPSRPPPPRSEPANAPAMGSSPVGLEGRTAAAAPKPPPGPSAAAAGEGGGSTPHSAPAIPATEQHAEAMALDENPSEPSGGNRENDGAESMDFGAANDDDEADDEVEEEEEDVYVPKVYGPAILPHDTWEAAWRKLEFSCWNRRVRTTWRDDGSKTYSYVYTKADRCSTGPNAVLDRDYFESLDKVKDFARKHYGWIGPDAISAAATSTGTTATAAAATRGATDATPPGATTRPQDPAAPRLDDDTAAGISTLAGPAELSSPSDESSGSPADRYAFKVAWERLRRKGWVAKRARDKLANWEYHPPPGTMPEGFYVKDNDALVEYVRKRDAEKRKSKKKAPATAAAVAESPPYVPPDHTKASSKRRKMGPKKASATFSEKLEKAAAVAGGPSRPRSHVATESAAAPATKSAPLGKTGTSQPKKRDAASVPLKPRQVDAKKTKAKAQWWKSRPVPSDDVVWPILLQLGYYTEDVDEETKSYYLPKSMYEQFPREDVIRFGTLQQLRLFLACYGTPPSLAVRIKKAQQEVLHRWIAFANVPVTHANSVQQINDASVVRNPDLNQLKALLFAHRFLVLDGTLYLPDSDTYERTVEKRRFGVHKFDEIQHVEGYLRPYLRRAWAVFYPSRGSSQRGRRDDSPDPKSKACAKVTKLESEDYYATLSLRLWAATSSHDLPVFSEWPSREELDKFFEYEASEFLLEPPTPQKSELSSDTESVVCSDEAMVDDDEPMEMEGEESTQPPETGFESVWDCVWPVLESKLGFRTAPSGEGYTHAKFPGELVLATPDELAKYLCKHGIPDYDDKKKGISPPLRAMLRDWVASAFVPPDAVGMPVPSDSKCLQILAKLGWQRCDDKYYAPGADDNRTNRIEGKDFFKGIDNLRLYLRSVEPLDTVDEPDQDEFKSRVKVTQDDLAAIRLWAAQVPPPLPKFGQAVVATGRGGRSSRRPLMDYPDLGKALPNRRSKIIPSKGSKGASCNVPAEGGVSPVERPSAASSGSRRVPTQTAPLSAGAASWKPSRASSWTIPTDSAINSIETFSPSARRAPSAREVAASRGHGRADDHHRGMDIDPSVVDEFQSINEAFANLSTQREPEGDSDSECDSDVEGFFSPQS